MKKRPYKKKINKQQITVIILSLAAILVGLWFILNSDTSSKTEPVSYSTNEPSEEKPKEDCEWKGGAEDPKRIAIPSLGIKGCMQNVGIDQNKDIAVPNNIYIAGWFVDSVLPGSKGLSIVDGHVDGKTQKGIFFTLPKVQQGAEVAIEFGNGSVKKFEVTSVKTVKTEEAANILFSQDPAITNQLNLITCTGSFDKKSQQYSDRVIVATKLIE